MKQFKNLTEQEKNIISQIVQDEESGNHLLNKRTDEYKELKAIVYNLIDPFSTEPMSNVEKEIVEYYYSCKPL